MSISVYTYADFNPRSPRGGATPFASTLAHATAFQSTLPTRGSDGWHTDLLRMRRNFNPRSPRGGATPINGIDCPKTVYFNPRSPRGGATTQGRGNCGLHGNFNPRSPRGGATVPSSTGSYHRNDFNPRSPRGGATRGDGCGSAPDGHFNPRSPRGGATPLSFSFVIFWYIFQSTLPTRGSDVPHFALAEAVPISIHAPHEGERLCQA